MTACRFGLREIEGRRPHGQKVNTHALFVDWAGVVRKLGKIPTITEYQLHGSYTYRPLYKAVNAL